MAGFLDDFSESFAGSFNTSYNTARQSALRQEENAAKEAAKRFLERQTQANDLRREDRERISRAQRLERELNLPEGTWANIYYWDLDGLSQDKIRDMIAEGTFSAIPAPDNSSDVTNTGDASVQGGAPESSALSGTTPDIVAQTNAAIPGTNVPVTDPTQITMVYTDYAQNLNRSGDPRSGQNQAIVDLVTNSWAQVGLGTEIGINSGYRGEDEANHDGNAFDINVSGLSTDQRVQLINQLSQNGAKGIGVGPTTIHVDMRGERNRYWWYDQSGDTATMPETLSWSAQALAAHGNGQPNSGGTPRDIFEGDNQSTLVRTSLDDNPLLIDNPENKPFLNRVNDVLTNNHLDAVVNILGITREEYEAQSTQLDYNRINPNITHTYVPRATGDDLPSTWNEAVIAQVMDSEEYKNAATPEARIDILNRARETMGSDAGPTSAKAAAFQLLIASEEYKNADQAGRQALLQQHERTWSDLGRAVPETPEDNRSAKERAFSLYVESDEYTDASPEEQIDLLANWERQWAEDTRVRDSSGSSTLTAARLAQLKSQAEIDLLSSDQATRDAAQNYLTNIYPIQERNLIAVNTAVSADGDRPTFNVRYRDAEGNIRSVTAYEVPAENGGGGYAAVGSETVLENVIEVIAPEDMEIRLESVRAASTIYRPALDLRSAVTVAAYGAYDLDRMAARSDYVLTTTGAGISMFQGAKNELKALMGIIGTGADNQSTQESILAAVDERLTEFVTGDNATMTQEVAAQYKEFSAAVIRYVFAAGKALGQEGNGFSNSDYDNILSSIVNANSYQAFSNNLRNFTNTQFANLDETISSTRNNPLIGAAIEAGAGYLINPALQTANDYFNNAQDGAPQSVVDRRRSIWGWSQGRAGNIVRYLPSVTAEDIAALPSLGQFEGRGVLIFDNGRIEAY